MNLKTFILGLFVLFNAHARPWKAVTIPGATCGTGLPYKIFVHIKNPRRWAFEFMGGGACWDASTCYGTNLKTWMFPVPKLPLFSMFGAESPKASPVFNHSMVYFPYCTGDLHVGHHTAKYIFGLKAYHQGRRNIELALRTLAASKRISFEDLEEVVLYGASAGGIAAIAHTYTFDQFLPPQTRRLVIADAPGLHWGTHFWEKFSPELIADFRDIAHKIGLDFDLSTGNIAHSMSTVCQKMSHWNFGVLQGSRDSVMSSVFGDISPRSHERNIYNAQGIYKITKNYVNCSAWTPQTSLHTFLLTPLSASLRAQNRSALEYLFEVYSGRVSPDNYR